MTKATYTEDNFEEYYRNLIEEHCRKEGMKFRIGPWDGARENMRDDAFGMDEATGYDNDEPSYTDEDLINEYLYFCLNDDLDEFMRATPFYNTALSPDDQGDGTYAMHVYREGDKPYSHYDLSRMDVYRGTYTFDKATCTYSFTYPVKDAK